MTVAAPAAPPAPNRALLRAPRFALPTVLLALAATAGWGAAVAAAWLGALPLALGVALATVCAYAAFTPMHDASHRSVGRSRLLNAAVGRLAGVPLLAPFPAFRFMHLEHHKHTSEPEADPDHWSGRGPWPLLPLRWLTQDLHYYVRFARDRGRFSGREQAEIVAGVALQGALLAAAAASGHATEALLLVFLPARLATAALAFAFDYLPHRPHRVTAREDRFRATHIITGRGLTLPLCAQNYHLVHHLYPAVPFYRYGAVWHDQREALLARGAREVPLLRRVRA